MQLFRGWRRSSRRPRSGEVTIAVLNGQAHLAIQSTERTISSDPGRTRSSNRWPARSWSIVVGLFVVTILSTRSAVAATFSSSAVVNATNKARTDNHLSSLTVNAMLEIAAAAKAKDMLDHQYFDHTSPSGQTPWAWLRLAHYDFTEAGENLAKDYSTATELAQAWLASSGHRQNMLNAKFNEIGVHVQDGLLDGHPTTIIVAYFGNRSVNDPEPVAASTVHVPPAPNTVPQVSRSDPAPVTATPKPTDPLVPSIMTAQGVATPQLVFTPAAPDVSYTTPLRPAVLGAADNKPSDTTSSSELPFLMSLTGLLQASALVLWKTLAGLSHPISLSTATG